MRLIVALVLFFAFFTSHTQAQKIVKFSQYKLYKSPTGSTKIKITPLSRMKQVGKDESKYEKSFGVYGVLICYTLNGEKKVKRQDMTQKLKVNGFYELTLAFGNQAKVSGVRVTYFNMIDEPKSKWPKKEDCL